MAAKGPFSSVSDSHRGCGFRSYLGVESEVPVRGLRPLICTLPFYDIDLFG